MPAYQTKSKDKQVHQDSDIHLLTKQKSSKKITQKVSKGPGHNIAQLKLKSNNTGLPDHLKSGMEHLSGMSLNHVKVHYNSPKPAMLQAHAYAQGSDIHLGAGQEKHLPHELAHVVQQAQGRVKPTTTVGGMRINDNAELEKEADMMGAHALKSQPNVNKRSAVAQKRSHVKLGFEVADNRQEIKSINQIQMMAENKFTPIQKRNAISKRKKLNKNVTKAIREIQVAGNLGGNATEDEIKVHDEAMNPGQHHNMRIVRRSVLIADLQQRKLDHANNNIRDSTLKHKAEVENNHGRVIQL